MSLNENKQSKQQAAASRTKKEVLAFSFAFLIALCGVITVPSLVSSFSGQTEHAVSAPGGLEAGSIEPIDTVTYLTQNISAARMGAIADGSKAVVEANQSDGVDAQGQALLSEDDISAAAALEQPEGEDTSIVLVKQTSDDVYYDEDAAASLKSELERFAPEGKNPNLVDTGKYMTVKYTPVDAGMVEDGDTMTKIATEKPEAVYGLYTSKAKLYDLDAESTWMVALTDSPALNGTFGSDDVFDWEFAWDNTKGIAINDMFYDKDKGIVYVKKGSITIDGEQFDREVQQQLVFKSDLGKKATVAYTIENKRKDVATAPGTYKLGMDPYDITLAIPVTTAEDASKVALSDIELYINGMLIETGSESALDWNIDTGYLTVPASGIVVHDVKVVLNESGWSPAEKAIAISTTAEMNYWGSLTNFDASKAKAGDRWAWAGQIYHSIRHTQGTGSYATNNSYALNATYTSSGKSVGGHYMYNYIIGDVINGGSAKGNTFSDIQKYLGSNKYYNNITATLLSNFGNAYYTVLFPSGTISGLTSSTAPNNFTSSNPYNGKVVTQCAHIDYSDTKYKQAYDLSGSVAVDSRTSFVVESNWYRSGRCVINLLYKSPNTDADPYAVFGILGAPCDQFSVAIVKVHIPKTYHSVSYQSNFPSASGKSNQSFSDSNLVSGAQWTVRGTNTFGTPTGWTFAGWNTKPDGSGTPYTANSKQTVSDDLVLYAQWRENTYRVKFVGDKVTSPNKDITVRYTQEFNVAAATPVTGYKFDTGYSYWNISGMDSTPHTIDGKANATNAQSLSQSVSSKFSRLNASGGTVTFKVTAVPITYKVNYNANGAGASFKSLGGATTTSQSYRYDLDKGTIASGDSFGAERDGWVFAGWSRNAGEQPLPSDADIAVGRQFSNWFTEDGASIDLYAVWRPKVWYSVDGDNNPEARTSGNVPAGAQIRDVDAFDYGTLNSMISTRHAQAAREGCDGEDALSGWFLDSAYTKPFNPETDTITAPTTLYIRNRVTYWYDTTSRSSIKDTDSTFLTGDGHVIRLDWSNLYPVTALNPITVWYGDVIKAVDGLIVIEDDPYAKPIKQGKIYLSDQDKAKDSEGAKSYNPGSDIIITRSGALFVDWGDMAYDGVASD